MSTRPHYELYCLYHNQVFSEYYGDQIDQITFVKMDRGSYVFPAKKHIYLTKESWFKPIGKEWAEYELYYSLYRGYLDGKLELPEYLGFIQYDMEFEGKEEKYKDTSVIDFIEDLIQKNQLNEKMFVSFQPESSIYIWNQRYIMDPQRPNLCFDANFENCMDTITKDISDMLKIKIDMEILRNDYIPLCGSFIVHRSIFIDFMHFLSLIIDSGRLNMFKNRPMVAGAFLERYLAVYLWSRNLNSIRFPLKHYFITGENSISFLMKVDRYIGILGKYLKSKSPLVYKLLNSFRQK